LKAWTTLCGVLALASAAAWLAGPAAAPLLQWDSALWLRQPWTLWTASLVHLSTAHLLANLLALGALAVLGSSMGVGQAATRALVVAWPLGTLALLVWPAVRQYSGLSGLIHAAVAVLWAHAVVHRRAYPLSFVLFVGMGLKLLTEHAWFTPVSFDPAWGFNVVYAAHLSGTLAGAACGMVAAVWELRRRAAMKA
jgi:rhomboid family GlyGly-CTERM serine protease